MNLQQAHLNGANLQQAFLYETNLQQARLSEADFRGIAEIGEFLTQKQINEAIGNEHTKLPDHLQRPAHWTNASTEEGEEY